MAQPGTFAELWAYIEKEAATLKALERKTLKACLSSGKSWKYYKMYLALEKTLSAEQTQVIEEWEKRNCMSDVRAAFRKFVAAAEAHFLGGRLIAKKEAKGRLAKWLRKNGLAVESRYGREKVCIWPRKNVEWPWKTMKNVKL